MSRLTDLLEEYHLSQYAGAVDPDITNYNEQKVKELFIELINKQPVTASDQLGRKFIDKDILLHAIEKL